MKRSKLTPLNKLSENHSSDNSRRSFLKKASAATFTIAGSAIIPSTPSFSQSPVSGKAEEEENIPWFRKITRWGQTNITEKDPIIYDIEWWRTC